MKSIQYHVTSLADQTFRIRHLEQHHQIMYLGYHCPIADSFCSILFQILIETPDLAHAVKMSNQQILNP